MSRQENHDLAKNYNTPQAAFVNTLFLGVLISVEGHNISLQVNNVGLGQIDHGLKDKWDDEPQGYFHRKLIINDCHQHIRDEYPTIRNDRNFTGVRNHQLAVIGFIRMSLAGNEPVYLPLITNYFSSNHEDNGRQNHEFQNFELHFGSD